MMKDTNALYSDVPPSKLREKEDPFISSDESEFWKMLFDGAFTRLFDRVFCSLQVKNAQKFEERNKLYPTIFYAPHLCWWDGIIGYLLCRKLLKTKMYLMVEELNRFPLLAKVGAFSVCKKTPRSSLKSLKHSLGILSNPGNSLWLYPQGIVRPPDYRPIKFMSGMSYLCNHIKGVNLIPVAVKYTFLRENKPEVLVEIGDPIILNEQNDRKELNSLLEQKFETLLDNQLFEVSNGFLDGYEVIHRKPLTIYKKIEQYFKNK